MKELGRDLAMGWTAWVQFLAGTMMGIYLFTVKSRLALGSTQPPNQWVPRFLPWG